MNVYKKGECYKNAYQYANEHEHEGWRIVHAIVTGQRSIAGVRFGHAWVERRHPIGFIEAHDPAADVRIPAELYRQIGEASDLRVYTLDDARREMVKHGHYGPWDEKISQAAHAGKKRRKKNPLISGDKDFDYVEDDRNWMYHYGDTGIGSDTVQWRMGAGRGTGHFGTGTYFVSESKRQQAGSWYGSRPEYRVNVTGLRLIAFKNSNDADKFHKMMKQISEFVSRRQDGEPWIEVKRHKSRYEDMPPGKKLSRLYSKKGSYGQDYFHLMERSEVYERDYPTRIGKPMYDVLDREKVVMGGMESELKRMMFWFHFALAYEQPSKEQRIKLTEEELTEITKKIIDKHARFRNLRHAAMRKKPQMITAGTELLMFLGYDGIDARNTTSDDFDRGSVLFPGWRNKVPPEAIQMLRGPSGRSPVDSLKELG